MANSHITSSLSVQTTDAISIITLNRAEKQNAVDIDMITALRDYFLDVQDKPEIRVIILKSTGKHFSAGADLDSAAFVPKGEGRAQKQLAMQQLYSSVIKLMRSCPQPIIALIQGAACGAGFSLVLAADVRIMTPDAKMNAAYLRIGLGGCDMGSGYLLPRLVGLSVASELLLTGKFIKSDRALATGLVSEVAPAENILETGMNLAKEMLLSSPMGLRMTKETLNISLDTNSLAAEITLEDRQQVILLETNDHQEAIAAFREKRSPVFKDC